MNRDERRIMITAAIFLTLAGLAPFLWYWYYIGRAPTITASEAKEKLLKDESVSALIDIRTRKEYGISHLEGAYNWPLDEIRKVGAGVNIPSPFAGKTLYLICDSGIMSTVAAIELAKVIPNKVFSVKGGMQSWTATQGMACPLKFCSMTREGGAKAPLAYRDSPLFEQWAMSVIAFGVKPFYMLLSLLLIIYTWRAPSFEMKVFKWGQIFFLIGESFCAVNYLFFAEESYLIEYLHSYGMVACFAYTTFAIIIGLDHRALHVSDPKKKCAALELCGKCIKYEQVHCGARRIFLIAVGAFIVACFMPILGGLHPDSYNTHILGVLYHYSHPVLFQLFEKRYLPVIALLFFAAAFSRVFKEDQPTMLSEALFSAGAGAIGFSFFRFIIYSVYRDNLVWFASWEEITELTFVAVAAIFIWLFRSRLIHEVERTSADIS